MNPVGRKTIHDAMVRLRDGDRSAFSPLVDQLWPVILSFVRRAVTSQADAEDLAQEVFFRVCSRLSDFDRTRDGLSWVFGIAAYEIMSHRRRGQRRREIPEAGALALVPDGAPSHEEVLLDREMAAALEVAVAQLSVEDRRSLGLLPAAGRPVAGATRRKRRQRALDRLRAVWRRVHGESG